MKENTYPNARLVLYTLVHLLVDCACIFFVMAIISPRIGDGDTALLMLVLYNACAFALPALVGIVSDIADRNHLFAALGCVLVASGYLFRAYPLAMAACIGIGNGLYHVGSGRQVLQDAPNRYAPCGIFIAFGALGLYIGRKLGTAYLPLSMLFIALLLISAALLLLLGRKAAHAAPMQADLQGKKRLLGVTLLCIVVVIRSYYGTILQYEWNRGPIIPLLFTLCIVGGKALGGVFADWIGLKKTILCSMALAAVFAVFSFRSALCGCVSIFFFNMTMPLTLSRMTAHLRPAPGFAFGFLMFCLFIGILPTLVFDIRFALSPAGLALLCLLSMALLYADERLGGQTDEA